ncbi:MAG: hypothetical protein PSY12_00825 [bacterium]|nr:hypothetical protein [bacterium]
MISLALALAMLSGQTGVIFDTRLVDVGQWRVMTANSRITGERFLGSINFSDRNSGVLISIARIDVRTVLFSFDAPRCGVEASLTSKAHAEMLGEVSAEMRSHLIAGIHKLADLCPYSIPKIKRAVFQKLRSAWSRLDIAEKN